MTIIRDGRDNVNVSWAVKVSRGKLLELEFAWVLELEFARVLELEFARVLESEFVRELVLVQ